MSAVDTSREAVGAIIVRLDALSQRICQPDALLSDVMALTETIIALRALLDRAEAAERSRDVIKQLMEARGTNRDYQQSRAEAAERDRDAFKSRLDDAARMAGKMGAALATARVDALREAVAVIDDEIAGWAKEMGSASGYERHALVIAKRAILFLIPKGDKP